MSPPEPEDDPARAWLDAQRRALAALGEGGGLDGLSRAWSDSLAAWAALAELRPDGEAAGLCREAVEQTAVLAAFAEAIAAGPASVGEPVPALPWLNGLAAWRAAAETIAQAAREPGDRDAPGPEGAYLGALRAFEAEAARLTEALAAQAWPRARTDGGDAASLRAAYERWLEEGDRIWLEHVSTERFAQALGGLVNAALALPARGHGPGNR